MKLYFKMTYTLITTIYAVIMDAVKFPEKGRKNVIKIAGLNGIVKFGYLISMTAAVSGSGAKMKKIPALGRPFALGDLYNVKSDQIVKGPKLWNSYNLQKINKTLKPASNFKVSVAENLDDKANNFDLGVELKLSFMSGMIEVTGSAEYLDHRPKTSYEASVSLQYKSATWFKEFAPEVFTDVNYDTVLEKVKATHVVSAIQYGAAAVFVFHQSVEKENNKRHVGGSMSITVRKIPKLVIQGSANVSIDEETKDESKNFTCTFYGDYILEQQPGNFEEAVNVYKELPTYLGEKWENSVPLEVYLFPIDQLPKSKAKETIKDVRDELINEVSNVMQHLDSVHTKANDIVDSQFAEYHERLRRNAEKFQFYVDGFKLLFQQQLARLLPEIRSDGKDAQLAEMLANKTMTSFSKESLDGWIEEATKEFLVFKATHDFPNYCANDATVTAKLLNGVPYTMVLTMRLQKSADDDEFLSGMKRYLEETSTTVLKQENYEAFRSRKKWWQSNTLIAKLERSSEGVRKYLELQERVKKEREKEHVAYVPRAQILTVEKSLEEGVARVRLELFHKAKLIDKDFVMPSEPGKPAMIKATFRGVTIQWSAPDDQGKNVVGYEVETWIPMKNATVGKNATDGKNATEEKERLVKTKKPQVAINNRTADITNLKPKSNYTFKVIAVTLLGKTTESEKSETIVTKDCPEGKYRFDERCHPCEPGHFSNTEGATSCTKCPNGTFTSTYNSKACTPCPDDGKTIVEGAKYVTDCGGGQKEELKNSFEDLSSKMETDVESMEKEMDDLETSWNEKINSSIAIMEGKVDSFYRGPGRLRAQKHKKSK